jgi:hypothetical protein
MLRQELPERQNARPKDHVRIAVEIAEEAVVPVAGAEAVVVADQAEAVIVEEAVVRVAAAVARDTRRLHR